MPIFNKKEEIFSSLCDYSIPMLRAAWFIKISSAYNTGVNESKGKKRIMADPASGIYLYHYFLLLIYCFVNYNEHVHLVVHVPLDGSRLDAVVGGLASHQCVRGSV